MDGYKAASRCFFTDYTPNPFVLGSFEPYEELLNVETREGSEIDEESKKKKGFKIPFGKKK